MKRTKASRKGFTIIEVVLVLAVAGLIFLMVFIALPALQRSQRNTRRRQDMARILSAFDDYAANNNGKMPGGTQANNETGIAVEKSDLANFVNRYIVGESGYATTGNLFSGISGVTPATDCGKSDQFCDPDGTRYNIGLRQNKPATNCSGGVTLDGVTQCKMVPNGNDHAIYYFRFAKCGTQEGYVMDGDGYSNIAIMYVLEGGAIYCGDTQ